MTDLEMTRLCAEAMQLNTLPYRVGMAVRIHGKTAGNYPYTPITNDAQAMALVKASRLEIIWRSMNKQWQVSPVSNFPEVSNADLNRAIVECVAKMQQAKAGRAA